MRPPAAIPASGSCFVTDVSPSTYWRQELFKIDHNITSSMKASFRYIHDSWNTTILTPQWGTVQNSFPTLQSTFTGPGVSMLAHLTNTISPSLLNEFIFSYTTDHITLANINANGATWQRPSGPEHGLSLQQRLRRQGAGNRDRRHQRRLRRKRLCRRSRIFALAPFQPNLQLSRRPQQGDRKTYLANGSAMGDRPAE